MVKILQPGLTAPQFVLPAVHADRPELALAELAGKKAVLVFFPLSQEQALLEQLAKFQEKLTDFEAEGAQLVGLSEAGPGELARLAGVEKLTFPLLSDSNPGAAVARQYGLISGQSAVFILDEERLIHRVYEPAQYPNLPNPAMVVRALKKLADIPKPPPVSPADWQLGPADAPVTVLEYADYECAPCGEAYRLLKQVIPTYGDKILWVHRHLPLRHSHPLAQQAAEAAEAAGAQGKFWDMHNRLFEARGALERAQLVEYAREIGLDVNRFEQELDNQRFKEAVNEDFKQAVRNKIKLPPVLFINGLPLEGPRTEAAIRAKIEKLLDCISQNS